MSARSPYRLFKLSVIISASLLTLPARATLQEAQGNRQERNEVQQRETESGNRDDNRRDDDDDDRPQHQIVQPPSGQYVTPTVIDDSVQQYLNPGLAQYPNFIAGEAVRSQLSPDGTTLAILPACR